MIHEGSGHFQRLIKEHLPQAQRILVVGCGRSGKEVVDLAHALPAYIEGFDVELDPEVNDLKTERYHIRLGDACAMDYPDGAFDAVLHVPAPQRSIVECARVLREGGYLYCGTPNRTRLVGYIGSRATLREKVRWNLAD
jgi:SAM-dependent methyltransferase